MKYTKKTTMSEATKNPEAEKVLTKFQIPCLYCAMAKFEMDFLTLSDVCQRYGIDIDELLQKLNSLENEKKRKN